MTKRLFLATAVTMSMAITSILNADTISFDDAYASLGHSGDPATYYSGTHGVTFSGSYQGLVGGNGNGDPGNWNQEGTNGSAFLGTNSGIGSGPDISFDQLVKDVSLDVGVSGHGWTNDIIASSFLNGNLIESHTVSISSPTDPGNWATIAFANPLDSLEIRLGSGTGFAFGTDNMNFSTVPEPNSMLGLYGLGAYMFGFVNSRRRRIKRVA